MHTFWTSRFILLLFHVCLFFLVFEYITLSISRFNLPHILTQNFAQAVSTFKNLKPAWNRNHDCLCYSRLLELEQRVREPGSLACVDSLLDTVTALVADCSLDPVKQLKNIEAYNSRCKLNIRFNLKR